MGSIISFTNNNKDNQEDVPLPLPTWELLFSVLSVSKLVDDSMALTDQGGLRDTSDLKRLVKSYLHAYPDEIWMPKIEHFWDGCMEENVWKRLGDKSKKDQTSLPIRGDQFDITVARPFVTPAVGDKVWMTYWGGQKKPLGIVQVMLLSDMEKKQDGSDRFKAQVCQSISFEDFPRYFHPRQCCCGGNEFDYSFGSGQDEDRTFVSRSNDMHTSYYMKADNQWYCVLGYNGYNYEAGLTIVDPDQVEQMGLP